MATPVSTAHLIPYLKLMLAKVRPGWLRIINGPEMKPYLHKVIRALAEYLRSRGVTDAHLERYGLDIFIEPPTEKVFAAFHHADPQNMVGIILGQDPYPGLGSSSPNGSNACGMSFSVAEGRKIPSSLANVYKALVHSGVLAEAPTTGDLTNWARRGMLLINTYFTRSTKFQVNGDTVDVIGNGSGDETCLHKFWGEFTEKLLSYLTGDYLEKLNHTNHYIGVMLWGAFAHNVGRVIQPRNEDGREVEVMKHGHPSGLSTVNSDPANPKAFINCPHFAHFLTKVPEFDWDPAVAPTDRPSRMTQFFTLLRERKDAGITEPIDVEALVDAGIAYNDATTEPNNLRVKAILAQRKSAAVASTSTSTQKSYLIIATDGGCSGNGYKRAVASYAAYVPATFAGHENVLPTTSTMSGLVPKVELEIDMTSLELRETDTTIQPSNNRGELLGLIHALIMINRYYSANPNPALRMILVVDSEYTIHFVNERMWKYMLKASNSRTKNNWLETVKANRDLISIVAQLLLNLCKLRGQDPQKIEACWNNLMQPAAHNYYLTAAPMDVEWPGLTVLYQPSHRSSPQSNSDIDRAKWEANRSADELAGSYL